MDRIPIAQANGSIWRDPERPKVDYLDRMRAECKGRNLLLALSTGSIAFACIYFPAKYMRYILTWINNFCASDIEIFCSFLKRCSVLLWLYYLCEKLELFL